MKKLFSTGSFVQWYQIKTFGGVDGMKMEGPQGIPATLGHTLFFLAFIESKWTIFHLSGAKIAVDTPSKVAKSPSRNSKTGEKLLQEMQKSRFVDRPLFEMSKK